MSVQEAHDEDVALATGQAQHDLLDALEKATVKLRTATESESVIAIREAAEAIIAVKRAMDLLKS